MAEQEEVSRLWTTLVANVATDERMSAQLMGFLNLVEPKGVLGDSLYLEAPNEFTRGILEHRIGQIILDALRRDADNLDVANFAVVVNPKIEQPVERPADEALLANTATATFAEGIPAVANPFASAATLPGAPSTSSAATGFIHSDAEVSPAGAAQTAPSDTRLNPKYTFDSFVTGVSNRFAHAASFAVAETTAKAYNPLFIYGNSGLGKTHLLHAIGDYALKMYPRLKVRYVSSEEFTNDFINAIQNNRTAAFQAQYRDIDILLIDDIQFLQGKDQTQEAFFHTFNTLHDHNKQVVITSDVHPKKLTGFEDRMLSRFEWGLLTDIQAPELETRIAILRKKAENDKLRVADEILEYIATRVSSNIRELEGTLIRITAFAALNRTPVDMQLVQTVLKDASPVDGNNEISPTDIINTVAAFYKISPDDIYGRSRVAAVAMARQIAMYICRDQTNLSLPKIGALFGGRDHTTVMYANKQVAELMSQRRFVYNQVTEILSKIRSDRRS
jgi:chromosomal replication initiator protein